MTDLAAIDDIVVWLDQRAIAVSNLGKPRSDNQYGRAATEVEALRERVEESVAFEKRARDRCERSQAHAIELAGVLGCVMRNCRMPAPLSIGRWDDEYYDAFYDADAALASIPAAALERARARDGVVDWVRGRAAYGDIQALQALAKLDALDREGGT